MVQVHRTAVEGNADEGYERGKAAVVEHRSGAAARGDKGTGKGGRVMDRAYTVKEIDELRDAVELRYRWGTCVFDDAPELFPMRVSNGNVLQERCFGWAEMIKIVEDRLRTYMLGGIVADDIYAEDRAKNEREAMEGDA